MIKHVVVAAAAPHATSTELDALVDAWRALPGQIPELDSLVAGRNLGLVDSRFAVASIADFASVDAWSRFLTHPSHVDFRERFGARLLDRQAMSVVQFEC